MRFKFNVTGNDRKALVSAIAEFLNVKPKYMGMPSMAYQIGDFTVDKDGTLSFDDSLEVAKLYEFLAEKGFTAKEMPTAATQDENEEVVEESNPAPPCETVGLTVAMPVSYFSEDALNNLKAIISVKGSLIKKALGVDNLPIEIDEEQVSFPWFEIKSQDAETVNAYTHFVYSLCEMARNQKRISPKEKDAPNEKYAFRCFLLRLGFIGDNYKAERKILLKNLSGSSAFKTTVGGADNELS